MNFKKVLILVLLISAVYSNPEDDDNNPEDDNIHRRQAFIHTLGQMIRMMARKKLQENINVPLVTKVILSHTTSRHIEKTYMDFSFNYSK